MRYVPYESIKTNSQDIPDGEIFTVHTSEKASPFIITEEKPSLWAFAMKIKGEITVSNWKRSDADSEEVKKSMQQIQFAKKFGWIYTNEKKIDDAGANARVYRCLYCGNQTQEVEAACGCRHIGNIEMKKIKSPFDNWN